MRVSGSADGGAGSETRINPATRRDANLGSKYEFGILRDDRAAGRKGGGGVWGSAVGVGRSRRTRMWESWKQRVNAVASDRHRRSERCLGCGKNKERVRSGMQGLREGGFGHGMATAAVAPPSTPGRADAAPERVPGGGVAC
jgi:hypothetical protein